VFLFIFESIGTSELILIGIIALIFLGPRKLPQIARTIGKTMADFRNTTNEFKSTWEREVNFSEEAEALRSGDLPTGTPTIARADGAAESERTMAAPEIRPASADRFVNPPVTPTPDEPTEHQAEEASDVSDKTSWL